MTQGLKRNERMDYFMADDGMDGCMNYGRWKGRMIMNGCSVWLCPP